MKKIFQKLFSSVFELAKDRQIIAFLLGALVAVQVQAQADFIFQMKTDAEIGVGAAFPGQYLPYLESKRVGVVANQTSFLGESHLVDVLLEKGVNVVKVFAPEHGFRGTADAGEHVASGKDQRTGLPIVSLYGKHKKPYPEDLADLDIVVFDIQDVGVRFYTYISTMTYVMEACAEAGKPLVILDRPNPNGFYVDGPILEKEFQSFVGLHPVPIVHGMTIAEYAQMVNGEGWLKDGITCELKIVKCKDYSHKDYYKLPRNPSPNLPNMLSIYLYPSLAFFEGTVVSVGRGTKWPFQVYGAPGMKNKKFAFTPKSMPGAKNPPQLGKRCKGIDLKDYAPAIYASLGKVNLRFLLVAYRDIPDQSTFFLKNNFINLLAGTADLQAALKAGKSEAEIRANWQPELDAYKKMRKKYLLYPDFE